LAGPRQTGVGREQVGTRQAVGVGEDDEVAGGLAERTVHHDRLAIAPVHLRQVPDRPGCQRPMLRDDRSDLFETAVLRNEHLERRQGLAAQAEQCAVERNPVAVRGDDDGDVHDRGDDSRARPALRSTAQL
jgi:hypothetical protein